MADGDNTSSGTSSGVGMGMIIGLLLVVVILIAGGIYFFGGHSTVASNPATQVASAGSGLQTDPFDLERFVSAQSGVYDQALAELRAGRKRSHWMWFVFPQAKGLGRSSTAQIYAIASLDEARAYLAHAILGPRLLACTEAATEASAPSLYALFGSPDDLKFISSMTLFRLAADDPSPFQGALERWNGGQPDRRTVEQLGPAAH